MTVEALSISPDFAFGAISGGFATLTTWQLSTTAKLNELIGKFEEHVRWHEDE
jgi:hypothetical protein